LFLRKDIADWQLTYPRAVGFPVLYPWMLVKATSTTYIYERNPYYFKVDSQGNQLPYIDRIVSTVVSDAKMAQLKVITGEVDFLREGATLDMLSLYKEYEEKSGYRTVLLDMHVSPANLYLNLTYPDPVWRKVVGDVRFRRALSMGINRQEIVDTVYYGLAKPSRLSHDKYDVKEANRLLDETGLNRRDKEGYRLGPDGKRFIIPIEITMMASDMVPVTELLTEYFNKLGVKTTEKLIGGGLWSVRMGANQLRATLDWRHSGIWWNLETEYYSWPPYVIWNDTLGEKGERPPELIRKYFNLVTGKMAVSEKAAKEIAKETNRMVYENVFLIETVDRVKYPLIVSKRLGNVSHKGFAITVDFAGEQLFFKE
jgi:peptide/nickel transport system substrate-binding protein